MSVYTLFKSRVRITVWICTSADVANQLQELVGTTQLKELVGKAKKDKDLLPKGTVTNLGALTNLLKEVNKLSGVVLFTVSSEPMKFFDSLSKAQRLVS